MHHGSTFPDDVTHALAGLVHLVHVHDTSRLASSAKFISSLALATHMHVQVSCARGYY